MKASYMISEVRQLVSWIESLNEVSPQVAGESAEQLGSALSTRDPPGWRPTAVCENSGDLASERRTSPISLLSTESPPALESSACGPENHQEPTEEVANSSMPSNRYTEHEQVTFEAEPALKRQEGTECLLESTSNLQKDTQDSIGSDNLQAKSQNAPNAHLDGEGEGEERSGQTDRCEASLREATNSITKSASFVGIEQHDAQPPVQDGGKKGNGDDENERIDTVEEDEDGGEEQTDQVEEGEYASSAHRVEGSDDGEQETPETPHMEPELSLNEERLQEDAQGYRASDSIRLAGGVNNAPDVSLTEELLNVQGTASPSKASAVSVSPSDVVSIARRELEQGPDARQIMSNDLVATRANITRKQAEQVGLTTQHGDDIEGAESHHSDAVCDEDEIVVANGPQCGPRSNGSIIDPRTRDTLGMGGHMHDLTDANDSSSNVGEDSDHTGLRSNTPTHTRPRAKRASATNSSIPRTPKKRRKMSTHFTEQTTCSTVDDIPDSVIQPPKMYQLIAGMLGKDQKHNTTPLTSFFFAIGSPYAINSLREACKQIHSVRSSGPFPEETGARRSTRALDRMDMHDKVSPILRRYHLVQLVKRRDELQRELNGTLCQEEPKKLKYGLRKQLPPKVLVGPKGAASRALEKLMEEAYPKPLQDTEMESVLCSQRSKAMKNRLSAGHNWHALQARFGIGILALLPVGKEVGVWNSE
jgi:hypothetical protein